MKQENSYHLTLVTANHSDSLQLFSYLLFILNQNKLSSLALRVTTLPEKRIKFTVLKSPHGHKTARTQLELRISRKRITLTNIISLEQQMLIDYILDFIIKNIPISTKLVINRQHRCFI